MLIVVFLLATVVLRFTIIGVAVYLLIPRARACPHCADDLALIQHRWLRRLVPALEHRWCLRCGWSGVVRRAPRALPQSRVISRTARS
jgi:hypothetical protein